jgi:hypothetical protein
MDMYKGMEKNTRRGLGRRDGSVGIRIEDISVEWRSLES